MNMLNLYNVRPLSIGFDSFFNSLDLLEHAVNNSYPPHDLTQLSETEFKLEIALAGYSKDQILIEVDNNVLSISSQKTNEKPYREIIHKGISRKAFTKTFKLADDIEITSATMENGMLVILFEKLTRSTSKKIEIQ